MQHLLVFSSFFFVFYAAAFRAPTKTLVWRKGIPLATLFAGVRNSSFWRRMGISRRLRIRTGQLFYLL